MTDGQQLHTGQQQPVGDTTANLSAAAAAPRTWLPVFLVVCLLAVLGGAGAVMLAPEEPDPLADAPRGGRAEVQRVLCEKMVEPPVLNLRSSRGAKFAKVAFRFEYSTRPDWVNAAKKLVATEGNWNRMLHEVLCTLKRRTAYELNSDVGLKALEAELVHGINGALFSRRLDGRPIAQVDRIFWSQVLVR